MDCHRSALRNNNLILVTTIKPASAGFLLEADMPARRRDFILYIGDTFTRQVNLKSGPDADIADFTGEFIVYNDDNTALITANSPETGITLHNGYIDIQISDVITAALSVAGIPRVGTVVEPAADCELPYSGVGNLARYVLRVESTTGVVTTLLTGTVGIVESIVGAG